MICPFCSTKLTELKSTTALIDICLNCKGMWFDSGEFVDFVRTLTESEEISPKTPQLFKEQMIQTLDTIKEKDKICPRCNQKLKKFNYAYDSNVFLDKCPHCQGMWVDGGEVKEVARYLKEDPRITTIAEGLIQRNETLEDLTELSKTLMDTNPAALFMPKIILPLGDELVAHKFPKISLSIIGLCILVFIGQIIFVSEPKAFMQSFGAITTKILKGEAFYSLFSSMFLHGGILHLLGNMFFFWIFGDNVEDRFSNLGYITFYLACGLAADFMHIFLNASSDIPAIGASGAISGVMGAYFVFYPKARIKTLFINRILYIPAFLWLGTWFLFQVIFGFIYKSADVSNIAWFAHIGGFVFGGLVAYFKKKAVFVGG